MRRMIMAGMAGAMCMGGGFSGRAAEDLDGVAGKVFSVDLGARSFRFLKQDVTYDAETGKGVANYHRIEDNCWSTHRGVAFMAYWLGDYTRKGLQWDVILFNSGLRDYPEIRILDLSRVVNESGVMDAWRKGRDVRFWKAEEQAVVGKAVGEAVVEALGTRAEPPAPAR